MVFEVTQDDIDAGNINDCNRCPVARALVRKLSKSVTVDYEKFEVYDFDKVNVYSLPESVSDWIINFDLYFGKCSKPFTFEIEIDD